MANIPCVTPQEHGAVADGVTNDAPAIQDALDDALANGKFLYVPSGTYRIDETILIRVDDYFPYAGAFGAGPRIIGAGSGHTVFDTGISSGAVFDLDSAANHAVEFKGVLGSVFDGFTIKRTTATTGGAGIRLRTALNVKIRDVHVIAMSGDGVQVICTEGDRDGSNMVSMEQVRIENCTGWGVSSAAAPGANEVSFLRMQHVFIQGCGTESSSAVPPSGGMRWKGQVLTLDQCAFAINQNVGLFIPGEAGLGQTAVINGTTFENNRKRGLYCTGITGLAARNLQFYNNDSYVSSVACEFDGSSYVVRQVQLDGVVVRATSGNNPYTAFKIGGANAVLDSCRVRNVTWENFDYPGQTRFDGFHFDHVEQCCELRTETASATLFGPSQLRGRGNKSPLRLRGSGSTSGEWIEAQIPNNGLLLSITGLAVSTTYHVYLFDDNGVRRLEASTTAPVKDAASGYRVKSGDATRLHVGRVATGGAGSFVTTNTGWLNPLEVPGNQMGVPSYQWFNTANGKLYHKNGALPGSATDGVSVQLA